MLLCSVFADPVTFDLHISLLTKLPAFVADHVIPFLLLQSRESPLDNPITAGKHWRSEAVPVSCASYIITVSAR